MANIDKRPAAIALTREEYYAQSDDVETHRKHGPTAKWCPSCGEVFRTPGGFCIFCTGQGDK
jgi:uncharacterized OB-fold protein